MPDSDAKPKTVTQYLNALAADRRAAMKELIAVINAHADPALKHGMQYGMPAWFVPHSVYPAGYHCKPSEPLPFASVASQKNHMAIYLFCAYTDQAEKARFVEAWEKSGKKLDMGASCVRFKRIDDVPLDVVGKTIKRMSVKKFIKAYEGALGGDQWKQKPSGKKAGKKQAGKKTAGKQVAKKRAASEKAGAKVGSKKTAGKKVARKVGKKTRSKPAGRSR